MFIEQLPSSLVEIPKTAMILAAGHGRRMLPLTERIPKPMLVILGKTILDRSIDNLFGVGVTKIIINVSHLASVIVEHVGARKDDRIILSEEELPLETGGGVMNALPHLGKEPFFIINGDSVWVDGMKNTLLHLAEKWNSNHMDALLMLTPTVKAENFDGFGDFSSGSWGVGEGEKITTKGNVYYPHSLGVFYQAITQFIGFPNSIFNSFRVLPTKLPYSLFSFSATASDFSFIV